MLMQFHKEWIDQLLQQIPRPVDWNQIANAFNARFGTKWTGDRLLLEWQES
jgi:hypothetical protein